jgi:hypothetical protein
MKWNPNTPPYAKINSKWIKDLNINPKLKKLSDENIKGKSPCS